MQLRLQDEPAQANMRLYANTDNTQHMQFCSHTPLHSTSLQQNSPFPRPVSYTIPPSPLGGGLKFHHRSRNPPSTSITAGRRRRLRPQLPTHPHPQRKIPHLPHAEYHPHRRRPIPRPVVVVVVTTTIIFSSHPRRIPPPHRPPQQQRPPRLPQRRAPGRTGRRSAAAAPAGGGGTGARPPRAPQLPAHDAAEVREVLGQRAEEGRGRGPGEVPRAAVRGAGEEAEHYAAWVDCGCVVVVVVVAGGEESSGDGSVCPGHGLGEMDFRSSISSGGGGGGGSTSGIPSSHPRREVRDDRHRRPPVVELHVVPVDLVPVAALERVVAEAGEVSEVEGRGHQGRRDGREGDDEVFVPSPPEIRAQAVDQVRHDGEGRLLLHVQVDPVELVAPQKVAEGAVVRLKIRARGEEGVGALCGTAEHAEHSDRGGFAEDEDLVPELGEFGMGGGVVVEG